MIKVLIGYEGCVTAVSETHSFLLFSGTSATFYHINTNMSWPAAQSYCRNHYTDLASIRNEAENLQIRDMKALAENIWIGLYRGAWRLINGSLPTLRYWKDGQPSSNDEDCAVANFEDQGKWEDWNCTDRRASVCYHSKKSFVLSLSFEYVRF
uniref:C-type lectin domain-containing protein n=1 Tax=Oryzias latipes TaxID=8090 RepID=A0A3P9LSH0_ORYLA